MAALLFWKTKFFRLNLKDLSFCWRGRERSFYVEWQKTETVQEPTVEITVRGICRPDSIRSRMPSMGRCVKLKTVTERRWIRESTTYWSRKDMSMNLEAESIRSRAASRGGCVKSKPVTEIRQIRERTTDYSGLFNYFTSHWSSLQYTDPEKTCLW